MFQKLEFIQPNIKMVNAPKAFAPEVNMCGYINEVFEFAYSMCFTEEGHHRDHRSGGVVCRNPMEQFVNVLHGKLAEFAVYKRLKDEGFVLAPPDLRIMGEGAWDDTDLICNGKKLNIKSAAYFSNLLLLEKNDWNTQGQYLPNLNKVSSVYDYFILCRVKPDGKQVLKEADVLNTDKISLKRLIVNRGWVIDLPGYINHDGLLFVINAQHILKQGERLNDSVKMDADNYYVQSNDLKPFSELTRLLKTV